MTVIKAVLLQLSASVVLVCFVGLNTWLVLV